MDERETQTPKEQLLAEVLEACMEEELSFFPSGREIAEMHTFSPKFLQRMEEMQKQSRTVRPMRKKEFVYGFNKAAACILVLFTVGGLGFLGFRMWGEPRREPAAAESRMEESPAMKAEENFLADSGAATEVDEQAAAPESAARDIPRGQLLGKTLVPAAEQELPAECGRVRLLVNSPTIARTAEELVVTIGNMEEYSIRYYPEIELEVLIGGFWYQLPPRERETPEEEHMVELETEMAQDETLQLGNYDLDYDAKSYRVVVYLDDMTLAAVFQFEEDPLWEEKEE